MKVARPDVPVVCATGDGGFLFAATELATAVQYGINTVTVVYNDDAYGNSNRDQRERFGGREIGTELRNPDFVKFAESFGADAVQLAQGRRRRPGAARRARQHPPDGDRGADGPSPVAVLMDRRPMDVVMDDHPSGRRAGRDRHRRRPRDRRRRRRSRSCTTRCSSTW